MIKTITVSGKEIRMRADALIPRLYRIKFGRDVVQDMQKLAKARENKEYTIPDLTVFEDIAYIMAKHADPELPDTPDEWLETIDGAFSIYEALPQIQELWQANNKTTSVPRKK